MWAVPHTPMEQILELTRPGDIVTHAFRRGGTGGVIGPDGRVSDYIRRAADRGILFDVGHGSGSFSFAATEAALKEKFPPTSISSDIHAYSALGPVFDLPTTMTKFLMMGVALEKVVELVTSAPAKAIHKTDMGSLKPGSSADIAVFDLVQGAFNLVDSQGEVRKATQKLVPCPGASQRTDSVRSKAKGKRKKEQGCKKRATSCRVALFISACSFPFSFCLFPYVRTRNVAPNRIMRSVCAVMLVTRPKLALPNDPLGLA